MEAQVLSFFVSVPLDDIKNFTVIPINMEQLMDDSSTSPEWSLLAKEQSVVKKKKQPYKRTLTNNEQYMKKTKAAKKKPKKITPNKKKQEKGLKKTNCQTENQLHQHLPPELVEEKKKEEEEEGSCFLPLLSDGD